MSTICMAPGKCWSAMFQIHSAHHLLAGAAPPAFPSFGVETAAKQFRGFDSARWYASSERFVRYQHEQAYC
jgi:hypothetical protein